MATSTSKYAYIDCDPNLCVGCQLCEYICSYTKTGEYNSYRSRIRTVRVNEVLITAIACRTCENAPCVIVCPRDALTQDTVTGIIDVNAAKCDGCAWCIEACDSAQSPSIPQPRWQRFAICARMNRKVLNGVKWCPKRSTFADDA